MNLKKFLGEMDKESNMKRLFEYRLTFLESNLLEHDLEILENDFQVVFLLSEEEFQDKLSHKIVESTNWKPTGKKDYWYRTDPSRPENQFNREIYIAQKKHTRTVPQFTWKSDLTRKDQHKFTREPNKTVRQVAAAFFGVSVDLIEMIIQKYDSMSGKKLYEASIDN